MYAKEALRTFEVRFDKLVPDGTRVDACTVLLMEPVIEEREPARGVAHHQSLGIGTHGRTKLYVFRRAGANEKRSSTTVCFPHLWPTLHNPKEAGSAA